MKYLIAIILFFTFIHPAIAAKMVKGSVPVVQPLQPPAAGISPNLSNNIQYQAPIPVAAGQVRQQGSMQTQAGQQASVYYHSSSPWLWWLFIILALGILIWFFMRKGSSV